ncbi:prolyl aminopeptidase [Amphiplicatus metriothermophilus]|uniref:Proline iminopeptidase n=1 Tax=Amphiplicatus metriothermophilus TaxID=1519374 RepID=A0A239PQA4_9PROT|nr:prolyl aminopeptidase [Amphiplicatus metriothermophilus]MBB5518378.1 proline iminopeptidase [Amphiplicatus metriothermophilus]SNT72455.1 prolyl aminopeptidase Serine peptidase. MEROPS family S33 [Amphiplicatus metriothermophilus]
MIERLNLYPPIEPFETGFLKVSDLHEIYYEVSGAPDGKPVVVCHGGPGGGSTPSMRRYFDPRIYRIVVFDQRGCGRSTPRAELRENTTWHLVEDMEKLRERLGIQRWQVFGGSWGSTLALSYAQTHPERVTELVLRGIFTLRRDELRWFYQEGANWLYPDAWEDFLRPIPEDERSDLIAAYYRRLTGDDEAARLAAAKAWSVWEGGTVSLFPSAERIASFGGDDFALAFARIECHYFINGGFFERDDQIIANIGSVRDTPAVIVQGRYDVVTPMKTAWELHKAWPEAEFVLVQDAGHAASEPGIIDALVRATNRFGAR